MPLVIIGTPLRRPALGAWAGEGCVRSSAWIRDFSSTHNDDGAMIRRIEVEPDDVPHYFRQNSGSFDSLKVSLRCGCSP